MARTTATRAVSYHGSTFRVPASWPVFDLSRSPATCVRFNRHAVYLGTPSAAQRCPGHTVGRTEALAVGPLNGGATLPPGGTQQTFAAGGLTVTATWGHDPGVIERAVGRRLHAAVPAPEHPGRLAHAAIVHSSAHASTYAGLGFDACSAPSAAAMNAWASSPYRAIGVYIGGANMGCSQPNLSSSWITAESTAGWHFILTYVGLQSPGNSCGCAAITPSKATAQGQAAANDAVAHAQALGIPAGNPIYDDMEQYNRTGSDTSAVLAFLGGWTTQLHADGYLSGVYSSGSSGITDLVNVYGTGYAEPDDIWIAHWNNQQTTADSYVPAADWPGANRLHQYDGAHNETYRGYTINIDGDYLDGATATAGNTSPFPDGTFIEVSGDPNIYRVAGGAPMYVSSWAGFGGAQPVQMITPQQFAELTPYPVNGTYLTATTGTNYRVAGGTAFPIASWSTYGGTPQPSVTVDAFDLANVGNPLVHLAATPLNGTIVEGLPSATYWQFSAGRRAQVPASPLAVAVPDAALAAFPVAPATGGVGSRTPPPTCLVPRLIHLSIARVRSVVRNMHCRLGQVQRPRHWPRRHLLRVVSQSAKPHVRHGDGFRISIRMA